MNENNRVEIRYKDKKMLIQFSKRPSQSLVERLGILDKDICISPFPTITDLATGTKRFIVTTSVSIESICSYFANAGLICSSINLNK